LDSDKAVVLQRPRLTRTSWRQVLMCVREVLREHYRERGRTHRAPPAEATDPVLGQHLAQMEAAERQLGLWDPESRPETELPLPAGTLIDQRYRVLRHRVTAGLGSYAGQYGYVCADEMPAAPPLGWRARDLLRHSLCYPLRRCLAHLWDGLCGTATGAPSQDEWDQAFNQVRPEFRGEVWIDDRGSRADMGPGQKVGDRAHVGAAARPEREEWCLVSTMGNFASLPLPSRSCAA
jgi:hypothetical protein